MDGLLMEDIFNIGPLIRIFALIDMYTYPDDLLSNDMTLEDFFDYTFSDTIKRLVSDYLLDGPEYAISKAINRSIK
jgi:hypothetical protein